MKTPESIPVYLEIGKKRSFACAVRWPGWSRGGKDQASALQTLLDYAPRYAKVLGDGDFGFHIPEDVTELNAVERIEGDASTDFGVPGKVPEIDKEPPQPGELERLQAILTSIWQAFDRGVQAAQGSELRKGPRGGGRDLGGIENHVQQAELGYLRHLGLKYEPSSGQLSVPEARQFILEGMATSARGEIPSAGPRGGVRWPLRYFARRLAWHALDHLWEIEDRVLKG